MSRKMRDLRITDMSLQEYIASSYNDEGYIMLSGQSTPWVISGLYIVDGFPIETGLMHVPTISVEHDYSRSEPFQLGPGRESIASFRIDIFARTDGERDDLGELASYFLRNTVPIYDFNIIATGGDWHIISYGYPEDVIILSDRLDMEEEKLRHTLSVRFDLRVYISSGYSIIN